MSRGKPSGRTVVRLVALLAVVVAAIAAAAFLRERRQVAVDTADEIKAKLDKLDPVTRAAVRARLTADAARGVRRRREP